MTIQRGARYLFRASGNLTDMASRFMSMWVMPGEVISRTILLMSLRTRIMWASTVVISRFRHHGTESRFVSASVRLRPMSMSG